MSGRFPLLLVLLSGCGHSEPFTSASEGAVGPLRSAPWPVLTVGGGTDPHWSSDERGIVYVIPRRPVLSPPDPPGFFPSPTSERSQCLALLPAGGGSALWQRCHFAIESAGFVAIYPTAAVSPAGRMAYVEAAKRRGLKFPVSSRVDLWVGDTSQATSLRRVSTLYRDSIGISSTPRTEINWLTDVTWLDDNRLLAAGWHLRPDSTFTFLRQVIGTFASDTVVWQELPASPLAAVPVGAQGGQTVVTWRTSGELELIPLDAGPRQSGMVPISSPVDSVVDLRCSPTSDCLILSKFPVNTTDNRYVVWRLAIPSMAVDSVGSILHPRRQLMRLAPTRGTAVATAGGQLVLRPEIAPVLP